VIRVLHHRRDPRFGTVDVILDATFDGLDAATADSPIFTAAMKAKHRIAVIQRQFGGDTYISYAPGDEDKVATALIASLTSVLGVPLDAATTVVSAEYDRY
jgi:hypothetical protein